jgi:BirA family biotin operon repressor/biotin-[acetyl-CoA-carboxylase] ligase
VPSVLTNVDLLRALAAIGVEAPVRADEVTPSTNDTARAMAEAGAPEWALVSASHQTAGRGRSGRTWTDAGEALLCSLVLRPSLAPETAGVLSLMAGAAMAQAIVEIAGVSVVCKWPNDLLLDDRKVGGILLESEIDDRRLAFVVAGIGVNLAPPDTEPGAGGIGDVALPDLLTAFLVHFAAIYRANDAAARARDAWLAVAATIGRSVRATTVDGRVVTGVAEDVDAMGGLVVRTDRGPETVAFGEIEHLR